MEFLNHKATLAELRPSGLVEVTAPGDGSLARLSLEVNGKSVRSVHRAAVGTRGALEACGCGGATAAVESAEGSLPGLVEDVLHRHRVNEALVVPVGKWRAVCDLLAFELTGDPSWQDIDAEASLHLNTRDPLLLTPRDYHIVPTMLGALLRASADDATGEHDLSIVAAGLSTVVEFRAAGAVVLTTANGALCEELLKAV